MSVIKVKVRASLNGLRGEASTIIEFEKEDWEEMDDAERAEACEDTANELFYWDYEVLDKDI